MVLDPRRIVFGEPEVQSSERRHGTAHADRALDSVDVERPQLLGEYVQNVAPDVLELGLRWGVAADHPLGQPDTAQLQADHLGAGLALTADDLGAPAPDVDDDRVAAGVVEAAQDRQENQPCLFLAGKNLYRVADPLGETCGKLGAVSGDAEGIRAGNADAARAAVLRLVDEALEALEGARGGAFVDDARAVEALSQAGDLAHPMGGAQALPLIDVGDKQPDGIGADIDGTDPNGGLGRG